MDELDDLLYEEARIYDNNIGVEEHRLALIRTLLSRECERILALVADGDDFANAFISSAGMNHIDLLAACLDSGININLKNPFWTALMHASSNGQEDAVRLLLGRNAKTHVKDNSGDNALMLACLEGHKEVVSLLLEKMTDEDVNVQNRSGWTALMFACSCGCFEIVESLLLSKNAKLNLRNSEGSTALMIASSKSHPDVVSLLLNHNADVDLKNNDGFTAVECAESEAIKEIINNHVNTSYVLK